MEQLIPIVSDVLQGETVSLLPILLCLLTRFQANPFPTGASLDPWVILSTVGVTLEKLEGNVLRTG